MLSEGCSEFSCKFDLKLVIHVCDVKLMISGGILPFKLLSTCWQLLVDMLTCLLLLVGMLDCKLLLVDMFTGRLLLLAILIRKLISVSTLTSKLSSFFNMLTFKM